MIFQLERSLKNFNQILLKLLKSSHLFNKPKKTEYEIVGIASGLNFENNVNLNKILILKISTKFTRPDH